MNVADLEPTARSRALDEACRDDVALRQFVLRLLDEERPLSTFEDVVAQAVGEAVGSWQPLEFELGTSLLDRYEVRAFLGRGGTASVWKVWDAELRSSRALKILEHPSQAVRARMQREHFVQQQVQHRNVVSVLDILEIDERQALVTELVDGPDLEAYLRVHSLTEAQVDTVVLGVLAGVQAVHEAGFVHRDIKPSNVLLAREGGRFVPKVADFGIARPLRPAEGGLTNTGALVGTLAYMAPEQIRDARTVDERTDVWALGCLLYRVVARREAFAGRDNGETIQAVLSERRPAIPGTLPGRWRAAITSALAPRPEDRPQSCAALRRIWQAPDGVLLSRVLVPPDDPTRPVGPSLSFDRNRFVGRASALADVKALLASNRLVTILGVGGLGKTRLAVELARRLEPEWSGGVAFVSLVEAQSVEGIVEATARALGLALLGDLQERIVAELARSGPTLLVLDNFEHVVGHAAETVGRWLDLVPELGVLATSRAPLDLVGEQRFFLDLLDEEEAVELFAERAREASAQFRLEGQEQPVERLVSLLDRLPLAIELAAARSRLLSPVALLGRLTKRFDVLRSPARDVPERQRTLWATMQWSWELLSADEQTVLAQLSVFEGDFTLEAVQAVVELADEAHWVEDVVFDLTSKGLVVVDEERLRMLVSVREFAAAKLAETSGQVDRTAIRHGQWFASLAYTDRSLFELDADRDNFVVATRRATVRGDEVVAGRCAHVASVLFRHFGPFDSGRVFVDEMLGSLTEPALRAPLLRGAAELHRLTGSANDVEELLTEAVEAARNGGSTFELVYSLCGLSDLSRSSMRFDDAGAFLDEALAVARADGAPSTLLLPVARRGKLELASGNFEAAEACYQEALALAETAAEPETNEIGTLYGTYGIACHRMGRPSEARRWYERTIEVCRRVGDLRGLPDWHGNTGHIVYAQGDYAEAAKMFREALESSRTIGNLNGEIVWTVNLGELLLRVGRLEESEALLRRAHEVAHSLSSSVIALVAKMNLGTVLRVMGRREEAEPLLTSAVSDAEAGNNHTLTAWSHAFFGQLQEWQGELDEARQRYAKAEALTRGRTRPTDFGRLVALHARLQVDVETGRALIAESEGLLSKNDDPHDLAMLDVHRAVLEARVGDVSHARAALERARTRIRDLALEDRAEIVLELQGAERLLDAATARRD